MHSWRLEECYCCSRISWSMLRWANWFTSPALSVNLHWIFRSDSIDKLKLQILKVIVHKFTAVPLRHILNSYEIPFDNNHSMSQLRHWLHKYIHTQEKGKYLERRQTSNATCESNIQNQLNEVRNGWPNMVSDNLKRHIHQMFWQETSSERLTNFTCACCAESTLLHECQVLYKTDFDLDLLQSPYIIETDHSGDRAQCVCRWNVYGFPLVVRIWFSTHYCIQRVV